MIPVRLVRNEHICGVCKEFKEVVWTSTDDIWICSECYSKRLKRVNEVKGEVNDTSK